MKWLRTFLVDDVSAIWQRWSVKIVAAQAVVITTWAAFSAVGLAPEVSNIVKWGIIGVFNAAALTAAYLKQSNLPPPV